METIMAHNITHYNGKSIEKAKSLRTNMTKEENHLWHDFLKTYPIRFYRQRVIDNYIVDFYCSEAKLVIEIDGSQHYSDDGLEYDEMRTNILEKYKLKVIRFTNLDINFRFTDVCCTIDAEIQKRLNLLNNSQQ